MRPQDSRFRPHWWATGMSDLGVEARPDIATYGQYDFAHLPPVPFPMDGDLAWLAPRPEHERWPIVGNAAEAVGPLAAACARRRLPLPPAFTLFMESEALQRKVRSSTACFIDLDTAPVPVEGGGHFVRFLADQQGCLYWYLYLTEDGADHAVVCSPDYFGSEDAAVAEDLDEVSFSAESFETFLCRTWLENEIWFASTGKGAMPDVGAEYLERYRDLGSA
ncbi:hypothetical protein [Glycomyces terrestris]|uniref:Uncharacterized protein n=1 Tax=Glycomyces terrestris TaxID=2493553 RepID=A0A426V3W5_9ACTN|nr:hypothetical protein [Glycomyces terrestris]RRS01557.1 hypothetical protein EIW28_01965 [Glycomyces terrestris]